jgi:L-2-hydroxyglutarate oxidase
VITTEVAIVGGGIVGLATAMALASEREGTRVVVLEKERAIASHQTGHNSGVIHSGLYYKPGSLKATTCTRGRTALERFCEEHGVRFDRCGKIVVATREEEAARLDELERRGRANGLAGVRRIGPDEMREREPHARGIAALVVPETGIVDFVEVARAYAEVVRAKGGEIVTSARVTGVVRRGDRVVVQSTAGEAEARVLVGCAGLWSDVLARESGVDPGVRIVPFRGEYYELVPGRVSLVRHLIYPVPDPAFPFLGVHFTRRIGGGVEAGPNAVLAFKREGYARTSVSIADAWRSASYRGFWRMARAHWRTALGEMHRSWSKRAFVDALRVLVPEVRAEDLAPAGAGVRAQALAPSGALVDDFHIVEAERMVHVLNAPSPAATASIAIGEEVARRVLAHLR